MGRTTCCTHTLYHARFTYLPQKIGITTKQPSDVPDGLYSYRTGRNNWIIADQHTHHLSQRSLIPDLPLMHELTLGQSVGLAISPKSEIHIFFNGTHLDKIWTYIPVGTPIWGVVDIFGECNMIKSEILSGESCG